MSDVFTAKVKNDISPALRAVGHISVEQDIRPAMKHGMGLVEDTLRANIIENSKGYRLAEHARKGVKSKMWTVMTNSRTLGFTTYLIPREWLYIFNDGTYKTGIRKTRKDYKTAPYTDRLGRHVPERQYKPGVRRGAIPALGYMDQTRRALDGAIFSILRHVIERAVNARLQQL